jgi:hypothetical protein
MVIRSLSLLRGENALDHQASNALFHVVGNPWVDTEKGKWDGVSYKTLTINFSFNSRIKNRNFRSV